MRDAVDDQMESLRSRREANEPSNLDVIAAYAPSDHLKPFLVGNTAQEALYVLASSWENAKVIAMMGGHIRSLCNATRWFSTLSTAKGSATRQAIRDRMPGALWERENCIIMRDKVYYDEPK
jgi:hypothetical protein